MVDLALTGERTLPGIPDENYWFQRHVVAYDVAAPLVEGRSVLDAGCGEGYGLARLRAAGATRVVGADLDADAVTHATATYAGDGVEVHRCELMDLPLGDHEIDVTVSFQVIEHVHDIPGYLASLRRVTRIGGTVLVATPNRLTFTPGSDTPVNPFHVKEFTADELRDDLTAAGLKVQRVLGVHHGGRIQQMEARAEASFVDLLTAGDPTTWSPWLRANVHAVTPEWFDLRDAEAGDIDASLDLLAVCRA